MEKKHVALVASNILLPISLAIFATGFFPHKPFIPGLAQYEDLEGVEPPVAPFDKVIFMVVDALRRYSACQTAPNVYLQWAATLFTRGTPDSSTLRGTFDPQLGERRVLTAFSLIRDGLAMPFTSHAQAPTVTMPRVKALTTGSIPSFLDMILNIAESDTSSTLSHQDTWIAQMKAKGSGKLAMYGDDTWLKLFPDTFDRADGTSSFFVSVGD